MSMAPLPLPALVPLMACHAHWVLYPFLGGAVDGTGAVAVEFSLKSQELTAADRADRNCDKCAEMNIRLYFIHMAVLHICEIVFYFVWMLTGNI